MEGGVIGRDDGSDTGLRLGKESLRTADHCTFQATKQTCSRLSCGKVCQHFLAFGRDSKVLPVLGF